MRSAREIQKIRKEIEAEKNNNKRKEEKGKKTQYVWRAGSGDSCSACLAMDGQVFDSPVSTTLHPNCQCTLEKEEVEVKQQEAINEQELKEIGFIDRIMSLLNNIESNNKNIDDLERMKKLKEEWLIWNTPGYEIADIFIEEYKILKETNAIGNDTHQHALAHARATSKYGTQAQPIAWSIGVARELIDFLKYIPDKNKSFSEMIDDWIKDERANSIGRELGLKYPNASRKELSDKLWEDYGIINKYFRESLQDAINQSKKYKKQK